jgi:hypothetical protein
MLLRFSMQGSHTRRLTLAHRNAAFVAASGRSQRHYRTAEVDPFETLPARSEKGAVGWEPSFDQLPGARDDADREAVSSLRVALDRLRLNPVAANHLGWKRSVK